MKNTLLTVLGLMMITILTVTMVSCDKRAFEPDSFEIKSISYPDTLFSGIEGIVEVVVVNKEGVPAPSQTITFKTNRGVIESQAITNEFGVASAKFTHSSNVDLIATVEASIQKSRKIAIIAIIPHPGEFIITNLIAIPPVILADNNVTTSSIRALVRNRDGVAVPNEVVSFLTDIGKITAMATTDSTGIANATFSDNKDVGLATITAKIDKSVSTVNVTIQPFIEEYDIYVFSVPDTIYADNDTTYADIKARVKTLDGFPVVNQEVRFRTNLGSINASAMTNDMGIAGAILTDSGEVGLATIEAFIGESVGTTTVTIKPAPAEIYNIVVTASPNVIYSDNNVTTSIIKARVKNLDGFPVVGQQVRFRPSIGQMFTYVITDDTGAAVAEFGDAGDLGTATIEAFLGSSVGSVLVTIEPVIAEYVISVTASPTTIYSDNNITYSVIKAHIRDGQNFPVIEEAVKFRSNIGQITSQVITDQMGIATATFWDAGALGVATIDAVMGSAIGSVNVTIDPTPDIDSVSLQDIPDIMSLEQQHMIRARAMNVLGEPVSDGTIMVFSSSKGYFEENDHEGGNDIGYTVNGYASVILNTGTSAGTITVTATVGTESDTKSGVIAPGPPANIYLSSFFRNDEGNFVPLPDEGIPVNFPNDIRISASVKDLYDNPVRSGYPVHFETTLGGIQTVAQTNIEGVANVNYFPSISAGTAIITANFMTGEEAVASGTTLIDIYSTEVQSIQFTVQDEIYLDVANTGGISSRPLRVELYDYNGNLVSGQHWVRFEILLAPSGVNINNEGTSANVLANNGVATASINSGTASGTVKVKASLVSNLAIFAIKSNIVVRSGPPSSIQPFIGDFDTGTTIGGGLWLIQSGAIVKDTYGNPVINGTAVHFYLGSTPAPPADTAIEGDGFVGNSSNTDEDGTPGVAYTNLIYNGIYTYTQIRVYAESGGITGNAILTLPINQPRMEVQVTPGHHDYFWVSPTVTNPVFIDGEINVPLVDGQGNAITGANIFLTANYGLFIYRNYGGNSSATPHIIKTLNGIAKGTIRTRGWEVPPPLEEYYTTVDVQLNAYLQGTNTLAQTSLTIRRYSIPNPGLRQIVR